MPGRENCLNPSYLPICSRIPTDPGYPRSDASMWTYLEKVPKGDNLSVRGHHHAIACFIAAAKQIYDKVSKMISWWSTLCVTYFDEAHELKSFTGFCSGS
jgi:hypothetical protein